MIRYADTIRDLTPAEHSGLATLVDLSRLVPVDDPGADVVRLEAIASEDRAFQLAGPWDIAHGDGVVRVPRALLRAVCAVTSADDEQRSSARDRIGRVPATETPLVKAQAETAPVISNAAVALRKAAVAAAGTRPFRLVVPWPQGKRWAAAVTHDLDVVAWWPLFTLLRLSELGRRKEFARVFNVLVAAGRHATGDPVASGVTAILASEARHGLPSTWFVLCGTPTLSSFRAGDLTYVPESPAARRVLARIGEAGGEIGLHGSQATLGHADVFVSQRKRLQALSGQAVTGVRQHFLRFDPVRTPGHMQAAGFTYDSTSGFPDRNGFRLGVADPVTTPGNTEEGSAFAEVPFCWMDRALSKYQGIEDPAAWIDAGLALANSCRDVQGAWVGIWHPNLTPPLGFPGALDAFDNLLARLKALDPWFCRMDDLVRWRSARRSVRVRRVGPDGVVEAYATGPSNEPLALEDAGGVRRESVAAR